VDSLSFHLVQISPVTSISEFDAGPVKVVIDGKSVSQVKVIQGTASFAVPRGEHLVELLR
jgi:hypothetical protein